jgi:hypothetical protein
LSDNTWWATADRYPRLAEEKYASADRRFHAHFGFAFSPVKTFNNRKCLGSDTLKGKYLQWFSLRSDNATVLRDVVRDLIEEGIPRQTLVAWAVEAGYSKRSVSSLLSRIFVSLGLRVRKKGAGRKPSAAALELLAHARSRYGKDSLKVLRAAWRAGKAQLAVANTQDQTNSKRVHLIVAPQLPNLGSNCGTTITANGVRIFPVQSSTLTTPASNSFL